MKTRRTAQARAAPACHTTGKGRGWPPPSTRLASRRTAAVARGTNHSRSNRSSGLIRLPQTAGNAFVGTPAPNARMSPKRQNAGWRASKASLRRSNPHQIMDGVPF